jgi:polar amino acid transport system substrate-binding protein
VGVTAGAVLLLAATASCGSGGTASSKGSSGCHPAHKLKTVKSDVLTVGADPSMPYVDTKKNGNLKGIGGDIVKAIAKRECLDVDVHVLKGSAVISAVKNGQIDLVTGGYYRTKKRGKVVGQTRTVWYDAASAISKGGKISTADSMKGHDVGVGEGSLFPNDLEKLLGSSHVHQYQTNQDAARAMVNGQVDFAVTGGAEGAYFLKKLDKPAYKVVAIPEDPRLSFTKTVGNINFPYHKSNKSMGHALDSDIKKLRKDGTVKKILKKYGVTDPTAFSGKRSKDGTGSS